MLPFYFLSPNICDIYKKKKDYGVVIENVLFIKYHGRIILISINCSIRIL